MTIRFTMWVWVAVTISSCTNKTVPVEKAETVVEKDATPKVDKSRRRVIPSEKSIVKTGDRLALFDLEYHDLGIQMKCDSCIFSVEKIYGTKNFGMFAFGSFEVDSNNRPYTLDLYYWDSKRGYRPASLCRWPRRLTESEQKIDFGLLALPFEPVLVQKDVTFRIINAKE